MGNFNPWVCGYLVAFRICDQWGVEMNPQCPSFKTVQSANRFLYNNAESVLVFDVRCPGL